ncbi:MAG: hypothetical protein ACLT4C_00365 [Butyricicoccus sp.]
MRDSKFLQQVRREPADRHHRQYLHSIPRCLANARTHALIECDEATFRKTSEYLPVECLVVNNIFRDQLDRYGEITHTLNAIREGITHVPNATALPERGLLAHRFPCGQRAEQDRLVRRECPDLQGDRSRAVRRAVLHPLQDRI